MAFEEQERTMQLNFHMCGPVLIQLLFPRTRVRLAADVWYKVTASMTDAMFAHTCDSTFDTVLAVYRGDCSVTLQPFSRSDPGGSVVCSDDSALCGPWPESRSSHVTWEAQEGETYFIRVAGYHDRVRVHSGAFKLTVGYGEGTQVSRTRMDSPFVTGFVTVFASHT